MVALKLLAAQAFSTFLSEITLDAQGILDAAKSEINAQHPGLRPLLQEPLINALAIKIIKERWQSVDATALSPSQLHQLTQRMLLPDGDYEAV